MRRQCSSIGSSRSRVTPARHLACGIYCAHVHYVRAPRARTLSYLSAQMRTLAVDCVRLFFVVVHCETSRQHSDRARPSARAAQAQAPSYAAMRNSIRTHQIKIVSRIISAHWLLRAKWRRRRCTTFRLVVRYFGHKYGMHNSDG